MWQPGWWEAGRGAVRRDFNFHWSVSSFMISQLQTDPRGQVRFNNTTLGKSSGPVCSPWWQSPLHICPQTHPCCGPGHNSPPGTCVMWHFPVHVVNGVTEQCVKSHWLCMIISHFTAERSYFIFVCLWIPCLLAHVENWAARWERKDVQGSFVLCSQHSADLQ